MRRRWLYVRLSLPWRLFRLTRPSEELVLDWRYRRWGRKPGPDWMPRERGDRLLPTPTHLCGGTWAGQPVSQWCGCWVRELDSTRVAASARVEVRA